MGGVISDFLAIFKENKEMIFERIVKIFLFIILYIIYFKLLTPSEFGIFNVIFLYMVFERGFLQNFLPCYVKYTKEYRKIAFLQVLVSIILAFGLFVTMWLIGLSNYVWVVVLDCLFANIIFFSQSLAVARENYKLKAWISLSSDVTFFILAFILVFSLKVIGILMAFMLSSLPALIFPIAREFKPQIPNINEIRKYIGLYLSNVIGTLHRKAYSFLEPTIYYMVLPAAALGIFYCNFRIATVSSTTVLMSIGMSIQPKVARKEYKKVIMYTGFAVFLLFLAYLFAVIVIKLGILKILFPMYKFYPDLLAIMFLGVSFFVGVTIFSNILIYNENYKPMLIFGFLNITIWLILTLMTRSIYGIAVAFLLSNEVEFICIVSYVYKKYIRKSL